MTNIAFAYKIVRGLLPVVVLFILATSAIQAQSALDGFDPNANGPVAIVVAQPDGRILIGGDFTTVLGVTRNRIARLNPDGTLDPGFNPNANNTVITIAVQADGKILAGGYFSSIGGQTRNQIARLDATTGLADSFNPNSNGGVFSIAVQADSKILAGGQFTSIGGQTRNNIARLDATTGLTDSFNPNSNDILFTIAVQADGKILAGGVFTTIGAQTRHHIARLDATTGLADSFDPNANGSGLSAIAVQGDGKILAIGAFTTIGGQARTNIARLDATTGLADSWNPNASAAVNSIAIQTDGKILVGGQFTSIGGQTRNRIARLDRVTGLADSFDPNANSTVTTIAIQQDGKVLVGGQFTTLTPNGGAAVTRNNIARLETNGGLDQTLDLGTVGSDVITTAVQPDGKILIGGRFSSVLGVTRNNIARLNADGTLDMAFNPNSQAGVFAIAVQPDGKIVVGGEFFLSIGGQTRQYIARLDGVTGAADAWNPNANSQVYLLAVQADGKVLAGGPFTSIGGQTRQHIARLDAVTGLADSFDPNPNGTVTAIALQSDGKILVGGGFNITNGTPSIGGQGRNYIARLDPMTGLADSWNPNSDGSVFTIAVQSDGKVLAGGNFSNVGGQTRHAIARLDGTTGLADSWDPNSTSSFTDVYSIGVQSDGKILEGGDILQIGGQTRNRIARLDGVTGLADSFNPNANDIVQSVPVLPDGKILVSGVFTNIGGQPRNLYARLSNDTAALQTLGATRTTINWALGGSSPQFARVTFESSTDNVSFAALGNGTSSGTNWILPGLSLQTGQNLYIRARGYYRSGYQNGSDSIAESVRNVFIAPAPIISGTATYGNAIGAPAQRFVSSVLISGAGSTNVSTLTAFPGGNYSLSGFGAGSYTITPTKIGGVNSSITSFDAAKIAQHAAGLDNPPLTASQLIVADVSGNGSINSFDAAEVARYAAGVTTQIGVSGNWLFQPASRNYASITADVAGQDYTALLMGEVSGNWMNTGGRPATGGGPERSAAVTAPHLVTTADHEVIVPISVEGAADKGIISYEFDLRYDPVVIQPQGNPVDMVGTVSSKLSVVANAQEAGLLRVVVYGAMPIDSNGVLLNLRFTAIGAPGSVTPLTWERIMFNEGDSETMATDGQVVLLGKASSQAEISGRVLNSMGEDVQNARVIMTDFTGQTRTVLSNGFGVYRFGNLQAGQTYTIRVESKRYTFAHVTASVTDQGVNIDMIAEP